MGQAIVPRISDNIVTGETGLREAGRGIHDAMSHGARVVAPAGLLICVGLLTAASTLEVGAQSSVLEVTSDTPAYCLRLLDRVSNLVHGSPIPPPPDVTRLSSEGQRMCDQGETRGGIQRLRRALVLMTHPDDEPPH